MNLGIEITERCSVEMVQDGGCSGTKSINKSIELTTVNAIILEIARVDYRIQYVSSEARGRMRTYQGS